MKTLKQFTLIFMTALLILGTTSCNKKKKDDGPKTPLEILTDGSWTMKLQESYDRYGTLISSNPMNTTYTFHDDGTYTMGNQSGTYTFTEGNPHMIHIHNTDYRVPVLTETEMVWEHDISGGGVNKFIFEK